MFPLTFASPGELLEIVGFSMEDSSFFPRLLSMGLISGKVVEVLSSCGSILIKIDHAKLAIGRDVAMKIIVRSLR
ncbi:MAG: FeoA family protein [Deltaproteobacteria bacterium]|nr:FeoA family protein [Deltaproteobacteria bacterium]